MYKTNMLIISDSLYITKYLISKFKNSGLYVIVVNESGEKIKSVNEKNENLFIAKNLETVINNFSDVKYLIYYHTRSIYTSNIQDVYIKYLKRCYLKFVSLTKHFKSKSFFITYGIYERQNNKKIFEFQEILKNIKKYGTLILTGDLLITGEFTFQDNLVNNFIKKALLRKRIRLNKNQIYYPLLLSDFVNSLYGLIFSLKAYRKIFFVTGRPLIAKKFVEYTDYKDFYFLNKEKEFIKLKSDETILIRKHSKKIIRAVIDKLNLNGSKFKQNKFNINFVPQYTINISNNLFIFIIKSLKNFLFLILKNKTKIALGLALTVLVLPFLLIVLSFLLLKISLFTFNKNTYYLSFFTASSSRNFSKLNLRYLYLFKELPINLNYFSLFISPSNILYLQSDVISHRYKLLNDFAFIYNGLLYEGGVVTENAINKTLYDLNNYSRLLGLLEIELKDLNENNILSYLILVNNNLTFNKNKIYSIINIAEKLPTLLGKNGNKNYALVFQNTSKLRPTGGLIETVSLVSIENMRLKNIITEDVSWFDKKQPGNIDPPYELKKYFDVENWYLKDTNWNPDFSQSAFQTILFLDKTLDYKFDGVIAINLETLNEINNNFLNNNYRENFNTTTVSNYPKTFELSELNKILNNPEIKEISLKGNKLNRLLLFIFDALENKDIQIFVDDKNVEKELTNLNWSGSFSTSECRDNCVNELVSPIEAVIDGNSEEILREYQLTVSFQEKILKRDLVIVYKNYSTEYYKTYVRIFTSKDVGFSPLVINDKDIKSKDVLNIKAADNLKEAGFLLELEPKQAKKVNLYWEGPYDLDFSKKGNINLSWIKQSGIDKQDLNITIIIPNNINIYSNPKFTLTDGGVLRYNTSLVADFKPEITW